MRLTKFARVILHEMIQMICFASRSTTTDILPLPDFDIPPSDTSVFENQAFIDRYVMSIDKNKLCYTKICSKYINLNIIFIIQKFEVYTLS